MKKRFIEQIAFIESVTYTNYPNMCTKLEIHVSGMPLMPEAGSSVILKFQKEYSMALDNPRLKKTKEKIK